MTYESYDAYLNSLLESNIRTNVKTVKVNTNPKKETPTNNLKATNSSFREVIKERSNWRDDGLEEVLKRNNALAYDFCVSEYDHGKSCAIINYVHKGDKIECEPVLVNYCEMRTKTLPYFTVEYEYKLKTNDDLALGFEMVGYMVHPHNKKAEEILTDMFGDSDPINLTEKEFITFLYQIRNSLDSKYYLDTMNKMKSVSNISYSFETPKNIKDVAAKRIISLRHRNYGWDVPCVDIDCIITNSENIPIKFVEFKSKRNHIINRNSYADKAIADLGDGCKSSLPVVLCCYNLDSDDFRIADFYNKDTSKIGLSMTNYTENDFFRALSA